MTATSSALSATSSTRSRVDAAVSRAVALAAAGVLKGRGPPPTRLSSPTSRPPAATYVDSDAVVDGRDGLGACLGPITRAGCGSLFASYRRRPVRAKRLPASAKATTIPVYVESSRTRTFACAYDWPGWCRSGKDEASALAALAAYAPRYAAVAKQARAAFESNPAFA